MGSSDNDPLDRGHFVTTTVPARGGGSQCVVEPRHDLRAGDTLFEARFSIDLIHWQTLTASDETGLDNGIVFRTYLCPAGAAGFGKLQATLP